MCDRSSGGKRAGLRKGDQAFAVFVPEMEPGAAQALADGHAVAHVQFGVIAQHFGQAIERDAAVEVMHMVDADIGAEPLQHLRHHVMRTAVQGCVVQLPVSIVIPVGVFKLMLDVEQPHARRRGEQGRGQKDQKDRGEAAEIPDHDERREDRGVGAKRTDPVAGAFHQPQRYPVLQQKKIAGCKAEEGKRMAIGPVSQSLKRAEVAKLRDSICVDVAHAAPGQIARAAVMGRMGAAPDIIGGQGQHADQAAHPVAYLAVGEKRAVAAIVLDGEKPQQEGGVKDGYAEAEPVADRQTIPGERPEQNERHEADPGFEGAAHGVGFPVVGKDLDPVT